MILDYELSLDDLVEAEVAQAAAGGTTASRAVGATTFLVAAGAPTLFAGPAPLTRVIGLILGAAVWFLFYPVAWRVVVQSRSRTRLARLTAQPQRMRVIVDDEGLHVTGNSGSSRGDDSRHTSSHVQTHQWGSVAGIQMVGTSVLVTFSSADPLLIPWRAFGDEVAYRAFADLAHERIDVS